MKIKLRTTGGKASIASPVGVDSNVKFTGSKATATSGKTKIGIYSGEDKNNPRDKYRSSKNKLTLYEVLKNVGADT